MNMERVAGVRFAGYGEYLQAETLAAKLTALNPKLPVQLVLTSWYPQEGLEDVPGPESLDGTEPVYADVRCESPSRLEHFVELLARMRAKNRQLTQQLKQPAAEVAEPVEETGDETPWLTAYLNQDF
jgi:hypothetical protein